MIGRWGSDRHECEFDIVNWQRRRHERNTMSNDRLPLSTLARAFEILGEIREQGGRSLADLSVDLDLPESTLHDYLRTLEGLGFLTRTDGEYDLGLRFLDYGDYVRRNVALGDVIQPYLTEVANETAETVWHIVEERGKAVYVQNAKGADALQPYASVGARTDLHDIAGGKAILAHLPEERVEEIADRHGLERRTGNTITGIDALFDELQRVRDRGYARNRGENIDGWRAVSSPIVANDTLYGALAVAGPENRFRGERFEERIPEVVTAAANELQLQLRTSSNRR